MKESVYRTIGMKVSTLWEDYLDTNILLTEVTNETHEKCISLLNAAAEVWSQSSGAGGDKILESAANQCKSWISQSDSLTEQRITQKP